MNGEVMTTITECVPDGYRGPADNIEVTVFDAVKKCQFKSRRRKRQKESVAKWLRNKRESVKKLRVYLKTYFCSGRDHYVVLTYGREPKNTEAVYKDAELFIRSLRRKCRKKGIRKLYWLYIVERGTENGRFHIHLIANEAVPYGFISKSWGHGKVLPGKVPTSAKRLHKLSSYCRKDDTFAEHIEGMHGWRSSKNLKEPKTEHDAKLIHQEQLNAMVTGNGTVNMDMVYAVMKKLFPGYIVIHAGAVVNPYMGSPHLSVMLQRVEVAERAEAEERAEKEQTRQRYESAFGAYVKNLPVEQQSLFDVI